jgi:hypothetical protein
MNRRDSQAAKQRSADRRLREDGAPRLANEVKKLSSLRLDVENGSSKYAWRIVVERAPALFEVPCPEDQCENGGHDLTRAITHDLRRSATRFEGESVCQGTTPLGVCGRVLKYVGVATYRDKHGPSPT